MRRAMALVALAVLVPILILGCRREDVDTSGPPREAPAAGEVSERAGAGVAISAGASVDEIGGETLTLSVLRGIAPAAHMHQEKESTHDP